MFSFIKKWFEKPAKVKPKEKIIETKIQPIIKDQPKGLENKEGRPRKEIDFDLLDDLIKIFCTGEECADILKVNYDTLNTRIKENFSMTFSEYFKIKNSQGKMSLRRRQFALTEKHPAMAIFLGKNYLHQKDDPIIDQSMHYHYTEISDSELLKRAKERGILVPKEIERRLNVGKIIS